MFVDMWIKQFNHNIILHTLSDFETREQSSIGQTSSLKALLTPFTPQAQKPYANYCPITVVYHNELASSELELGNDWRVYVHDELLQALKAHFGDGNVEVGY